MAELRRGAKSRSERQASSRGAEAIAVVDSDHLQRVCTISTFSSAGVECLGLSSRSDLLAFLERGGQSVALAVALHPNSEWSADDLLSAKCANGNRPLMLVAHESELDAVRGVMEPLLGTATVDFVRSPISLDEFTMRMNALQASAEGRRSVTADAREHRYGGPSSCDTLAARDTDPYVRRRGLAAGARGL